MVIQVMLLKAPSDDDTKDSYQEHLQSLGLSVSVVPVIEFTFLQSDSLLAQLRLADCYDGIIFTSKRSVQAVQAFSSSGSLSLESWREKTLYVVGESTEKVVRTLLGSDSLGGHTGSAEALAQFIINREQGKRRFLFPKGNLARSSLVSTLTKEGHEVEEVVVYKTVPNRDLRAALDAVKVLPDYIVIFSPSGAGASLPALLDNHPDTLRQAKIIAIGPTTQAEVERLGFKVDKVCGRPSAEALGDLLTDDYKL